MERERGWVVPKHSTQPVSVRRGTKDVPGSKCTDKLVFSKISSLKNKNTPPHTQRTKQQQQQKWFRMGKGVLSESNPLS